jgi:diacylglycerol kinase (ATP)
VAAGRGLTGDALFSEAPGHLTELARKAVDDGAELLVVVGGDGAFHEVVNGIVGRDVELALMMRGTGMDFPRTYGIPTKTEDAADVAVNGATREIDLGKVTYRSWAGGEAVEHFGNIASAGMSAAVARRANAKSKAMGGKASFFVALVEVFFSWRNVEMRVRVGDEERSGKINNTVVANGQYHGGGMWLAPEARPDDGLFDVLVFGDLTKTDFVRNVGKIYKGTHLSHPKIEQLRGPIVEIDADEPLPVELDGEQPGTTPARFEIVPRALRVRVPA